MRKAIFILFLVVALCPLSAKVLLYSNLGLDFMICDEKLTEDGNTYVINERATFLSLTNDIVLLNEKIGVGFLLGLGLDAPLSCELNGVSIPTDFSDLLTNYRVGLYAVKSYDEIKYHASAGYRLAFDRDAEFISGGYATLTTLIHYADCKIGLETSFEDLAFDFGLSASRPISASAKLEYMNESATESNTVSGVCIKPYIGLKSAF